MTKDELKIIEQIAREKLPSLNNRPNLDPQNSDTLDFVDIAVWSLKDALIAAFEAGRNAKQKSTTRSAHWRKYSSDEWICSHCGYDKYCDTLDGGVLPPYCENCGAQMNACVGKCKYAKMVERKHGKVLTPETCDLYRDNMCPEQNEV